MYIPNLVHYEQPRASLDCVAMRDHGAVVHIVTNDTHAEPRRFTNQREAIDFSFGMIEVLKSVR